MLRACWGAFFVSVIAVAVLSIARTPREPLREPSPSDARDAIVPAGAPSSPEVAVDEPALAALPLASRAAHEDEFDLPASAPPPPPAERPAPEAFMNRLIELACLGKIDELAARVSPGVARKTSDLAMQIALIKSGHADAAAFEQNLRSLSFEFETLPDGAVKVRVKGPGDDAPSQDFYLLPDGDTWKLAAESDFQEDVSSQRAGNRLKLLALCQMAYRSERLGGDAVYASSAAELRQGLDGVDLYAGVLDAEFAKAVDGGVPYGDYIYGRLETSDGGVAHYATPAAYGDATRDTVIVDAAGKVWSKDLEGAPPPAAWPGPDPAAEGWRRGGRQ